MTVLRHKGSSKENFKKLLAGRSGRRAVGGRRYDRRKTRGQPAGRDASADALGRLLVDLALAYHAAERLLEMVAGTAEPVVKLDLTQGRVEVVAPQQTDHPPPGPYAFRLSGNARQQPRRLGVFVDLFLFLLGRLGRRSSGRLLRLLGLFLIGGSLCPCRGNCGKAQRSGEERCTGTQVEHAHGRPDASATELTRTECNTRIGHLCGA